MALGAGAVCEKTSSLLVETCPARLIAKLLNCNENDYVCYSERLGYLDDKTPAEFVESYIRSDYFRLELSFS